MSGLSAQQAADYRRDGFLSPLRALSADQADAYRAKLELFEHELGGRVTSGDVDEKFRYRLHTLHPWAHELATLPGVLDVIEDLIGPDILIYMTTMFIKEPGTEAITSWHQDATYFGFGRTNMSRRGLPYRRRQWKAAVCSSCRRATTSGSLWCSCVYCVHVCTAEQRV